MKKSWIITGILFVISVFLWWFGLSNIMSFEYIGYIALVAITTSVICICSLFISIAKTINGAVSPKLIFAIVDGIISLGVLIYSLYDMENDSGMMAGIKGFLLLYFVLPILIIMLIIDILLMLKKKRTEE